LPGVAFGCGQENFGFGIGQESGLVGFGQGSLSFISQLGPSLGNKFSYCLVSVNDSPSKTSPLFIGQKASLSGRNVSSTPIIQSSWVPTLYYLSLEGISVGGILLDIPAGTFDLTSNGTGGLIIDSGTTITYLEQAGYDLLRAALISTINLTQTNATTSGLDLCYKQQSGSSAARFPIVTFHFKGANYYLPKENYIYVDSNDTVCLAMLPNLGMSIFGNI